MNQIQIRGKLEIRNVGGLALSTILGERFMHVARLLGLIPNRPLFKLLFSTLSVQDTSPTTSAAPLNTPISLQLATIFGSVTVSPLFPSLLAEWQSDG